MPGVGFAVVIANGYLELGDESGNGQMDFAAKVQTTTAFPGVINWTQLIRRSSSANVMTTDGQYYLDTGVLYNTVKGTTNADNVVVNTSATVKFLDNPGVGISSQVFCDDGFQTYLMFRPDDVYNTHPSIWVPLGIVNWGWSGFVSGGNLTSSSIIAPTYSDTTSPPTWPSTIHGTGQPQ